MECGCALSIVDIARAFLLTTERWIAENLLNRVYIKPSNSDLSHASKYYQHRKESSTWGVAVRNTFHPIILSIRTSRLSLLSNYSKLAGLLFRNGTASRWPGWPYDALPFNVPGTLYFLGYSILSSAHNVVLCFIARVAIRIRVHDGGTRSISVRQSASSLSFCSSRAPEDHSCNDSQSYKQTKYQQQDPWSFSPSQPASREACQWSSSKKMRWCAEHHNIARYRWAIWILTQFIYLLSMHADYSSR